MSELPRVLIVDDHPLARRTLLLGLRAAGYPCRAVATPAEAFAAVSSFEPEVVLLEWAFRDELQREMRTATRLGRLAQMRRQRLAIVVLSHLPADDGFCEHDAIVGYLVKPVEAEVLRAVIQGAVSTHT